jgi:hypothetical protein
MSDPDTPRLAGRAGPEELPGGIDDPSARIYAVRAAAAEGEVDGQAAFELAAAPALARAATPESANRFRECGFRPVDPHPRPQSVPTTAPSSRTHRRRS